MDNLNNVKTNLFLSQMLHIIVNADDLGNCEDRDAGIFELFNEGIVSSSSILANGLNFIPSIKKATKIGLPLGLHLNLTEGEPIYLDNIETNTLVEFNSVSKKYEMHGKHNFRDKIVNNEINNDDIQNEVIHQILKFIENYNNIPTHVDGHQHIHIIPKVASIIAHIITNYFGIYQIRLPIENYKYIERNITSNTNKAFYKTINDQSLESQKIFKSYNIASPNYFIGMSLMGQNMTTENFNFEINDILENEEENKENEEENKEIFIELMCHPGNIPQSFFWDDFNSSSDRVHEKDTLKHIFSQKDNSFYNYKICNFLNLPSNRNNYKMFNILILGDFTFGTGNGVTAIRLKSIFQKLNFNVYFCNVKYINKSQKDSIEEDRNLNNLELFMINKKIHFIVGVHLWRSGRVLNLIRSRKDNLLRIPYILIVAGTDANLFINNDEDREVIKIAVLGSEKIISFNEEMKLKLENKLGKLNCEIIPQSVNIEENSKFSIRKKLNIPDNFKITLFPSGIRSVKDPKFVLNEIFEILDEMTEHIVILIGAKLDCTLYDELNSIIKNRNQKRFFIHDPVCQNDFINVLKESQLVINTSITEGMSNVIMESMKTGIPILARKNEGNCKLIEHNENGLIFEDPKHFKQLYYLIYNDEKVRNKIIHNARNIINDKFSYEKEIEKYKNIIHNSLDSLYYNFKLCLENKKIIDNYLIFLKNVHPFSDENNEVIKKLKIEDLKENNLKINILDVGCGSGIFSFIFLLNNRNIKVNELVLTDIDLNCLSSSFQNFLYNKNYFQIDYIKLIKSDLLKSLDPSYHGYFDIVLANMPQTPSLKEIRS